MASLPVECCTRNGCRSWWAERLWDTEEAALLKGRRAGLEVPEDEATSLKGSSLVSRSRLLWFLMFVVLMLSSSRSAEEGNSISSRMGLLSPMSRRLPPPLLRRSLVEGRSLGRSDSWPREPRLNGVAPASGPRPLQKEACRWYISSGGRGRSTAMLLGSAQEAPELLEPEELLVGESVRILASRGISLTCKTRKEL